MVAAAAMAAAAAPSLPLPKVLLPPFLLLPLLLLLAAQMATWGLTSVIPMGPWALPGPSTLGPPRALGLGGCGQAADFGMIGMAAQGLRHDW